MGGRGEAGRERERGRGQVIPEQSRGILLRGQDECAIKLLSLHPLLHQGKDRHTNL